MNDQEKARHVAAVLDRELDRLQKLLELDGVVIIAMWHDAAGRHEIIDLGNLPSCTPARLLYADLAKGDDSEDMTGRLGFRTLQ